MKSRNVGPVTPPTGRAGAAVSSGRITAGRRPRVPQHRAGVLRSCRAQVRTLAVGHAARDVPRPIRFEGRAQRQPIRQRAREGERAARGGRRLLPSAPRRPGGPAVRTASHLSQAGRTWT